MLIGIIEVSEPCHYSAVNGLVKTYASDPDNKIIIYTLPAIQGPLEENGLPENASLAILHEDSSLEDFLKEIESLVFERIHICTIFDNSAEFSRFKPQAKQIFLHVHQCEEWYNDNLSRALKTLFLSLKNKDQNRQYTRIIGRAVVDYLVYRSQRQRMLLDYDKYYDLQIIVHSNRQKETLLTYGCKSPITVFPFAIYEGMEDCSGVNRRLDICIPGVISEAKRSYLEFFKALEQQSAQLRDHISLHLLGFVTHREEKVMKAAISDLEDAGYRVRYHDSFVYGEEFDKGIASCDLLLNNQVIQKNSTEVYGQTKESGMIFNMLRAAKPGLLPKQYNVSSEFYDSTLFFQDYDHLMDVIQEILLNPTLLERKKLAAKKLSANYLPENLYHRLVSADQGYFILGNLGKAKESH